MPDRIDEDEDRECRLDEAAAEYFHLRATGQKIDRQQWLMQYPDLANDLAGFLSNLDHLSPAPEGRLSGTRPLGNSATIEFSADAVGALKQISLGNEQGPRYLLRSFLAAGGMGEVWIAEDKHVGRQVAVKRIRQARLGNADFEARFLFESQVMGQLEHPCIIPLHDLGRNEAGELYSVMKLFRGSSLKQRLTEFHSAKKQDWQRQVEFRRILEAFASICHAVAYAHSRGVIHRDIKPDNVMLGDYGETTLLDWGLAKAVHSGSDSVETQPSPDKIYMTTGPSTTHAGAIVGSPFYMSPELATGQSECVDEKTDVYLLGATLYEILTGQPPRSGSSTLELIELAQHTSVPPPRKIDLQIPKPLEAVCLRAMAHRREDRYSSATALAHEIEKYLAGQPVVAYREPLAKRAWRWCKRNRRPLYRASVAVFLLLCGSAVYISVSRAQALQARETAQRELSEFRRLADETQFFASNTDAVQENAPYFDPHRAKQLGSQALDIATQWRDDAAELPLEAERTRYIGELHGLLLVLANLYQRSPETESQQTALKLLERVSARHLPSRAEHQIRASCWRQLGLAEAAERELELASGKTQLSAMDWFLEGERLRTEPSTAATPAVANGNADHAIPAYQEALRIDPQHYWAHFQLARCYLQTLRGPEAVEALGTCIALRPNTPWAYSTRGLVRGMLGQFALAESDFAQALAVAPEFRPAILNRGYVYSLQGREAEALTDWEAVLQPPNESMLIEAAYYRAQLSYQHGDYSAAQQDVELFLKSRLSSSPALVLLAKIHFRQGADSLALSCVDKLLTLKRPSTSQEAISNLARARLLKELALAFDSATQQRVLRLALHELELGAADATSSEVLTVKDLLGLAEEVLQPYSTKLEINPKDIKTRLLRGWVYASLGRFEMAAEDFLTVIQQDASDAESHSGLGYVRALQGDRDTAQIEATSATLLGATRYKVVHNVACIYGELAERSVIDQERRQHEDQALTFLRRAIALYQLKPGTIDEFEQIRIEPAFHDSFRARPEFQQLLKQ